MHLVSEIWGRICIVLGAILLAFLGRDRFYLRAQGGVDCKNMQNLC